MDLSPAPLLLLRRSRRRRLRRLLRRPQPRRLSLRLAPSLLLHRRPPLPLRLLPDPPQLVHLPLPRLLLRTLLPLPRFVLRPPRRRRPVPLRALRLALPQELLLLLCGARRALCRKDLSCGLGGGGVGGSLGLRRLPDADLQM